MNALDLVGGPACGGLRAPAAGIRDLCHRCDVPVLTVAMAATEGFIGSPLGERREGERTDD